MGKKSGQLQICVIDIGELVPENHLLKKIDKYVDFEFIYELAQPYYSSIGRKSVDPVVMVKMLLIGYLYGIKSERRLVEEINLNIGYRWFCGFNIDDKIPEHSLFSQNRRRRFTDSKIFQDIFNKIVMKCIEKRLVTGENMVSDGTFIPANVAWNSRYEATEIIQKSTVDYLDSLKNELENTKGYKEPPAVTEEKKRLESRTDPDCRYVNQPRKKGLGYLCEMTVDTENGIVTGVDCYGANRRESDIILKHLENQQERLELDIKCVTLDSGYDVGAVHRGLELLDIVGYCSPIKFHNNALKKGFEYDCVKDCFVCLKGKELAFNKLIFKKSTFNYYRMYALPRRECIGCENLQHCAVDKGKIRINASSYYGAMHRNRERCSTDEYKYRRKLRSIWSEGTFAVLKREHKLKRAEKRGIHRVYEECLLSALALNLKRMVRALSGNTGLYLRIILACVRHQFYTRSHCLNL